jgi:hypothetical protein
VRRKLTIIVNFELGVKKVPIGIITSNVQSDQVGSPHYKGTYWNIYVPK